MLALPLGCAAAPTPAAAVHVHTAPRALRHLEERYLPVTTERLKPRTGHVSIPAHVSAVRDLVWAGMGEALPRRRRRQVGRRSGLSDAVGSWHARPAARPQERQGPRGAHQPGHDRERGDGLRDAGGGDAQRHTEPQELCSRMASYGSGRRRPACLWRMLRQRDEWPFAARPDMRRSSDRGLALSPCPRSVHACLAAADGGWWQHGVRHGW